MTEFLIESVPNEMRLVSAKSGESYRVSEKKGRMSGVAVSVSGSGAWGKLDGSFSFTTKSMEKSKTYQKIKNEYKFKSGVNNFWCWLIGGQHASEHREEVNEMLHEIQSSESVKGTVNVSLYVSGEYPNVEVTAYAYVFILEVSDKQGNTFRITSSDDPKGDVGGQDQDGNLLPSKDNTSTIEL
jgi:hypothetical protein